MKVEIQGKYLWFLEYTQAEFEKLQKLLLWEDDFAKSLGNTVTQTLLFQDEVSLEFYTFFGLVDLIKDEFKDFEIVSDDRDDTIQNLVVRDDVLDNIILRDYQVMAVRKSINLKKGIIELPTAGGKTEISLAITRTLLENKLIKKALIVTPSVPIVKQFKERSLLRGFKKSEVGCVYGKEKDFDKPIVFAVINTLAQGIKEGNKDVIDLVKNADLTVLDECFSGEHYVATEKGPMSIRLLYYKWFRGEGLPRVWSYNTVTSIYELKNILKAWRVPGKIKDLIRIRIGKKVIRCSEDHLFFVGNSWKKAKELQSGDVLLGFRDSLSSKLENHFTSPLNSDQYQILLGSFLGDGSITHNKIKGVDNNRIRLRLTHGEDQKYYLKWKAKILGFRNKITKGYSGYRDDYSIFKYQTKTIDLDRGKVLPEHKASNIPDWVFDDLDARGLAIWFMDDGTVYHKKRQIQFHTERHDLATNEFIVKRVESKFGIKLNILKSKTYYYLVGGVEAYEKLYELIGEYIVEEMPSHKKCINCGGYSWDDTIKENHVVGKVYSTEKVDSEDFLYDLEVEDNHTYIVCSKKDNDGVVAHNCHHARSDSFLSVASLSKSPYLIGMSGTPFKDRRNILNDIGDSTIYGLIGRIILKISQKSLVELGYIADTVIFMKPIGGMFKKYKSRYNVIYKREIVDNDIRNKHIVEYCNTFVQKGLSVLISVNIKNHAISLMRSLKIKYPSIRSICIFGGSEATIYDHTGVIDTYKIEQESFFADFEEGKYDVIVATQVMDEGVDLPSVGALILAGSGKSIRQIRQRLGRGVRSKKTGRNEVFILDFFDKGHVYMYAQSKKRLDIYLNEVESDVLEREIDFLDLIDSC